MPLMWRNITVLKEPQRTNRRNIRTGLQGSGLRESSNDHCQKPFSGYHRENLPAITKKSGDLVCEDWPISQLKED